MSWPYPNHGISRTARSEIQALIGKDLDQLIEGRH